MIQKNAFVLHLNLKITKHLERELENIQMVKSLKVNGMNKVKSMESLKLDNKIGHGILPCLIMEYKQHIS